MPRTRTIAIASGQATYGPHQGPPDYTWPAVAVSRLTDEKTKPCNCDQLSWSLTDIRATSPSITYQGQKVGFFIDPSTTYYIVSNYTNSLNWKKLPSSNEAGLLQNLAELDDTAAMFGKKFAESLSYGGYKWGWGPLLSDVAAVNDAVVNCQKEPPGSPARYHDVNEITKSVTVPFMSGGEIKHTWTLKTKYEGFVNTSLDILSYYDFMGFHPSPKVLWDLVPLSFAVDWVLPVGDAISRISPTQGWVKTANFTGWQLITATCVEEVTKPWYPWDSVSTGKNTMRQFSRRRVENLFLEQKTVYKDLGAKWPSGQNLLDYAYLANTFANKKRR